MTPTTELSTEVMKAYERFCPSVLSEVMHEVIRAEKLHGPLPTDYCRAQTIACEEMGEVAEASLEMGRPFRHAEPVEARDAVEGERQVMNIRRQHLREEWIQLAAVAFRAIENLDKEVRDGSFHG